METVMSWDWMGLLGLFAAFVIFFDRLAKLTPTQTDDKIVTFFYRLFSVLGLRVRDNVGVEKISEAPTEGQK